MSVLKALFGNYSKRELKRIQPLCDAVLALEEKYNIPEVKDVYECLTNIAESRHCLIRGSELDTEKAASILLDDFRGGRLGRITLERPET